MKRLAMSLCCLTGLVNLVGCCSVGYTGHSLTRGYGSYTTTAEFIGSEKEQERSNREIVPVSARLSQTAAGAIGSGGK